MQKGDHLLEYLENKNRKLKNIAKENDIKIKAMFKEITDGISSKDGIIKTLREDLEKTKKELAVTRVKLNQNLISPEARMRIESDGELINQ